MAWSIRLNEKEKVSFLAADIYEHLLLLLPWVPAIVGLYTQTTSQIQLSFLKLILPQE